MPALPARTVADLDAILDGAVAGREGVPGVVAMATDRSGTFYAAARGHRCLGGPPMTEDTVVSLYSTTKSVTATAVLQCVEEGLIDLQAPASTYLPELGDVAVLVGFDDRGEPLLRAPARPITMHMLLLHTSGFAYSTFNEDYRRLTTDLGRPGINRFTAEALRYPLVFDPGDRWEYGIGIDWAGCVVEAVRGQRLGDVVAERINDPLGIDGLRFDPGTWPRDAIACIHARQSDGSATVMPDTVKADPPLHMGGHGLYGTARDYLAFIRMWLDDGRGPRGRVLRPDTIDLASRDGLAEHQRVRPLNGVMPLLSRDVDLHPGLRVSWAYAGMVNAEATPTGRSPGSVGWAGLANLYYWIDRRRGVGGFWATQVLPFGDAASMRGFIDFESAIYRALA